MTRDTEDTTYRGYPIQVQTDRIIVTGPNRTRAEFNSMARARHFIRTLIALEMTGTAGEEPAASEFTPDAPGPVISSASALTDGGSAKSEIRATDSPPDRLAVPPPSVSATTTEPGDGSVPVASRGPIDGKPAGPSDLVALNYLRGME